MGDSSSKAKIAASGATTATTTVASKSAASQLFAQIIAKKETELDLDVLVSLSLPSEVFWFPIALNGVSLQLPIKLFNAKAKAKGDAKMKTHRDALKASGKQVCSSASRSILTITHCLPYYLITAYRITLSLLTVLPDHCLPYDLITAIKHSPFPPTR
jgi:hypothetical protein